MLCSTSSASALLCAVPSPKHLFHSLLVFVLVLHWFLLALLATFLASPSREVLRPTGNQKLQSIMLPILVSDLCFADIVSTDVSWISDPGDPGAVLFHLCYTGCMFCTSLGYFGLLVWFSFIAWPFSLGAQQFMCICNLAALQLAFATFCWG